MLEELPFLHLSVLMLVYLWQVACTTTCQHSLCYFQPPSFASSFQGSDSMNESTWSARRLLQLFSWKQKLQERGDWGLVGRGGAYTGSVCTETKSGEKKLKGHCWQVTHTNLQQSLILLREQGAAGSH